MFAASQSFAQAVDTTLWVTDAQVYSMARSGNTLYIGGSFSQVGPATGCGAPIDLASGTPVSGFPKVTGTISAVVQDGFGGWFIGGQFSRVGGFSRRNIARILSDNSVSAWDPSADSTVYALAKSGTTLYAGGEFTSIGGQTRNHIAELDLATGLATTWNPNASSAVRTLALAGARVYVGGSFITVGGQMRNRIAALDVTTGSAVGWDPNANSLVSALAVNGSTVYAGGGFTNIGGQSRTAIAALDVTTAAATTWNPGAGLFSDVLALFVNGTDVYVGGGFSSIGGQSRNNIAALSRTTGLATSWNPNANNTVNAVMVNAANLLVGGDFTSIGGQTRNGAGEIVMASGTATTWNPNFSGRVSALAMNGSTAYAGGAFFTIGAQTRRAIAALDVTTGAATAWNPGADANGAVFALANMGSTVYAAGSFSSIGGQARSRIAALDATTGVATAWNPNADNTLVTLAVSGSTVYAGGSFTNIGGQARNRVAALDATTGAATAWNPNANASLLTLSVSGATIYAGGNFTSIGGQTRNRIAALDSTTGAAKSWNPDANNTVLAVTASGTTVWACGDFTTVGGQARNQIAGLDVTTAAATAWNPNANGRVQALVISGTTVYAGGSFTSIGGQARNQLAALDATSGLATGWNPNANVSVHSLAVGGAKVHAGGFFTSMGGLPQSSVAAITASPALTGIVPASGGNAGPVTATVYGSGLAPGSSLKLMRSGQSDMVGSGTVVAADGTSLTATLNLAGALAGAWDVRVTGPDAQSATLLNGFTVEAVTAPQLRVSVVGSARQGANLVVRRDRRTAFDLVIENPGNVDALSVPLWLAGVPLDAMVEADVTPSYPSHGGMEPDWSTVPLYFTSASGKYVPLVIPRVPPGTTTRRMWVTVPGPSHAPFTLTAAVTPPWVDGNKFRSCIAGSGGITNPSCMGTQLDAINATLAGDPSMLTMSGIAIWAKNAYMCESASSLGAALTKAEQVLDYLEGPVEGGGVGAGCEDVLQARWRDALFVSVVSSLDPNDKLGAVGTLSGQQALPYSIRFENVSTATASAQDVIVTDQLDGNALELTTVSLDQITFGSHHIYPPPGLTSYATTVDLRPTQNLLVNVAVNLDPFTHVLSWYFNSIDPATGRTPTNAQVGFLPPNLAPPQGEGSVLFSVMPKSASTSVSNSASILFDDPPATTTPAWLNALDNTPPGSHVLSLSANSNLPTIPITWTADGSPSDLRDFTIYVSEDGAPYRVWRLNTPVTGDTLAPPKDHHLHNYDFYSVARDQIGNIEAPPLVRDATTQSTTAVEGVGAPRLALEGAWPNPAVGALRVQLTLPGREPATLELLDVAGRRIARREVGLLGPGSHVVVLTPLLPLRAGLYFLRLTQGERLLHARVAVVR